MQIKDSIITNVNEDGTIVVLDLENNTFYELNEIATIIFTNLDKNEREISDIIFNEYDVEREQLQQDVRKILSQFERLFLEK